MSKQLILKDRFPGADGKSRWHDGFVLQTAIDAIAKGKSFSKIALWLAIAGKIQYEFEKAPANEVPGPITVELRNVEARKLWEEICKLKPEEFGRDARTGQPASPNPGHLYIMLADIAEQLGERMPPTEADDDENDGQ